MQYENNDTYSMSLMSLYAYIEYVGLPIMVQLPCPWTYLANSNSRQEKRINRIKQLGILILNDKKKKAVLFPFPIRREQTPSDSLQENTHINKNK